MRFRCHQMASVVLALALLFAVRGPLTASQVKVTKLARTAQTPPRESSFWSIVAGQAHGPFHIGMPYARARQKLIHVGLFDELKEETLAGKLWICARRTHDGPQGWSLALHCDSQNRVRSITSSGRFPGTTPKGIGYQSTSSQVISALGKPDRTTTKPDGTVMSYKPHLDLTLLHGKVTKIEIVR